MYPFPGRTGIPWIRYPLHMTNSMDDALPRLLRQLELEDRGDDVFRGHSPPSRNGRIFGGFVFAQSMRAAAETVEERPPHSAHAYFLRPGDPEVPIDYEVDRIRDGRSFTTRRVVAKQDGTPIFNLSLSCQVPEPSVHHQRDIEIPEEPSGETHEAGIRRALATMGIEVSTREFGFSAFEVLVEGGLDMTAAPPRTPELGCWIRARGSVVANPGLHAALLAYVSDLTIVLPAYHPHDFGPMTPGTVAASLDHAMWFHEPFPIDEWVYAFQESPILTGSRTLGRALYYTRDGRLVASAVQEGLVRRGRTDSNG